VDDLITLAKTYPSDPSVAKCAPEDERALKAHHRLLMQTAILSCNQRYGGERPPLILLSNTSNPLCAI
jgi:hypothetical protein